MFCIEEDEQCFGWALAQNYDDTAGDSYYNQLFYSGAYIGATFSATSILPDNWTINPTHKEGVIVNISYFNAMITYGFNPTYWYS
jgi:hypothetical protein